MSKVTSKTGPVTESEELLEVCADVVKDYPPVVGVLLIAPKLNSS